MKIVHVSFYYDNKVSRAEELLERYYTITGWAEALARRGAEVVVMNRFNKDVSFQQNNVQYHFIKDKLGPTPGNLGIPWQFLKKISGLDADIIHLHHLTLSLPTFILRYLLPRKTTMIIQHHGGVAPGKMRRFMHNLLNKVVDGYFFTTVEQGQEWLMTKKKNHKIMPVMEGATFFSFADRDATITSSYTDRAVARKKTGLEGGPMFLWVGRLDDNKDPLTILNGIEIISEQYPNGRLYMIYSSDELVNQVRSKIDSSPVLKSRVHLLGQIAHREIKDIYQSADYFVLGSHYEGSGYALGEALRCGCIPIITDIPSFRMMSNNGELGALWEPGSKDSFVKAVASVIKKNMRSEAIACIEFFNAHLSFDAIAQVAMTHYQKAVDKRLTKR